MVRDPRRARRTVAPARRHREALARRLQRARLVEPECDRGLREVDRASRDRSACDGDYSTSASKTCPARWTRFWSAGWRGSPGSNGARRRALRDRAARQPHGEVALLARCASRRLQGGCEHLGQGQGRHPACWRSSTTSWPASLRQSAGSRSGRRICPRCDGPRVRDRRGRTPRFIECCRGSAHRSVRVGLRMAVHRSAESQSWPHSSIRRRTLSRRGYRRRRRRGRSAPPCAALGQVAARRRLRAALLDGGPRARAARTAPSCSRQGGFGRPLLERNAPRADAARALCARPISAVDGASSRSSSTPLAKQPLPRHGALAAERDAGLKVIAGARRAAARRPAHDERDGESAAGHMRAQRCSPRCLDITGALGVELSTLDVRGGAERHSMTAPRDEHGTAVGTSGPPEEEAMAKKVKRVVKPELVEVWLWDPSPETPPLCPQDHAARVSPRRRSASPGRGHHALAEERDRGHEEAGLHASAARARRFRVMECGHVVRSRGRRGVRCPRSPAGRLREDHLVCSASHSDRSSTTTAAGSGNRASDERHP